MGKKHYIKVEIPINKYPFLNHSGSLNITHSLRNTGENRVSE